MRSVAVASTVVGETVTRSESTERVAGPPSNATSAEATPPASSSPRSRVGTPKRGDFCDEVPQSKARRGAGGRCAAASTARSAGASGTPRRRSISTVAAWTSGAGSRCNCSSRSAHGATRRHQPYRRAARSRRGGFRRPRPGRIQAAADHPPEAPEQPRQRRDPVRREGRRGSRGGARGHPTGLVVAHRTVTGTRRPSLLGLRRTE